MAPGNFFPALGGGCQFRLWRAAICFLSSGIVDLGGRARVRLTLANGSGSVHLAHHFRGGHLDVEAGPRMASCPASSGGGNPLPGESLSSPSGLLPQPFFRGAPQRDFPPNV